MSTSRCVYCGTQAKKPVHLSWVIAGDGDRVRLSGKLALCTECSHSWCPETLLGSVISSASDES